MAETFIEARDGERWDELAMRAYGKAGMMGVLITANRDMGMTERLVGGTVIKVPLVAMSDVVPVNVSVPPWER